MDICICFVIVMNEINENNIYKHDITRACMEFIDERSVEAVLRHV